MRCNIGDAFTITNKGKGIKLYLNPQGFSNLNTSGMSTELQLDSFEINTGLVLITAGTNIHEKNVNIVLTAIKTNKNKVVC